MNLSTVEQRLKAQRMGWFQERRMLLRALEDATAALAHHCIGHMPCERCDRFLETYTRVHERFAHNGGQKKRA